MEQIDIPQDIIDAYARDGCVHIPGAFAGPWRDRLLDASNRIIAEHKAKQARGEVEPPPEQKPGRNMANAGRVTVNQRYPGRMAFNQAVYFDPDFIAWKEESCAADLVAKVTQSKTLRYLMDTTFIKENAESDTATPVHHDIAVYCFKGTQVPSLWIPLYDVGEDDAPLQTVLGSHLWQDTMYRPPTDKGGEPLPDGYKELSDIPARIEAEGAEWRTWLCKAGDALLIHPYTLHASLPMKSTGSMRIGFSSRWMGDDVVWAPNALSPSDHIKSRDTLKPGDSPPDDQYPIVYTRH